jgi:hypothetical protein
MKKSTKTQITKKGDVIAEEITRKEIEQHEPLVEDVVENLGRQIEKQISNHRREEKKKDK